MLKNYLKIVLRNFLRHKTHTAINVLGLAFGIASCLLILLHIQDELRFDAFHQKAERIFRIVNAQYRPGQEDAHFAYSEAPLGPALVTDLPQAEATVRFFRGWRLTVKASEPGIIVRNYFFTEPSFFQVFDFTLLHGEASTALTQPGAVVLTETAARQYFGEPNPLGKTLRVEAEDFPEFGRNEYTVTGVLRDLPANSHLQFDLLMSSATLVGFEQTREMTTSWDNDGAITYVLLKPGHTPAELQKQFPALSEKYRGAEAWARDSFYLQPLKDVHFYSQHISAEVNQHEGEIVYVYVFSVLALVIALIACINYMNLATALAANRAKEIGLRKVIGAQRPQLVRQFFSESLLTTFVALLFAVGILELALPAFNNVAGKKLALDLSNNGPMLAGMLAMLMLIGLVAGSYPALYLSRFQPVATLKGMFASGAKHSRLRHALVVTQFALSIIMIIATLVVREQLQYARTKALGFNQERLVVVDINNDDVQTNFKTIKTEFLRNANVRSVSVSSRVPGDWKSFRQIRVAKEGAAENEAQSMFFNGVDEDFMKTYEIDLIAGRNFSQDFATDSTALLLNETAARALFGEEPLGKVLRVPARNFAGRVVGVVRDFHFHSIHRAIAPLVMGYMPPGGSHVLHGIDYFSLRLSGANLPETIDFITKVHARFDRVNPIEIGYLDQWWRNLYQADDRVGSVFGVAAGLAILIACVGLFGLAAFMAEQRAKEIGVRKVLGASVQSLVMLLSKDFTKLVSIAFVIAVPVAYFAMNRWLENFAYRIDVGPVTLALAGLLALAITWMTVSYQAIKAALANPVEALRYE